MKIYYCSVEPLLDEKLFLQGMKYADRDRRIKIEQLKHPLDKARSLGCFLLYRYIFVHDIDIGKVKEQYEESLYKSLTVRDVIMGDSKGKDVPHINIDKNGKPDIDHIYNAHISFSHSGVMAAVAYQEGENPVGMDIQIMSSRKVKDHVAEYIMSKMEYNVYSSDCCCDKCDYFYQVLCCKEAYTKMTGEGINMHFGKLDIGEIDKKYNLHFTVIDQDGTKYMLAVCGIKE